MYVPQVRNIFINRSINENLSTYLFAAVLFLFILSHIAYFNARGSNRITEGSESSKLNLSLLMIQMPRQGVS